MSTITIRNISSNLHKKLQNRAKISHRSLNNEIIFALESAVLESNAEVNEIIKKSEDIRSRLNFKINLSEINTAKKLGRA